METPWWHWWAGLATYGQPCGAALGCPPMTTPADAKPTRLARIKANPLVQLVTEVAKLAMIGAAVVKVADKVEDLRRFRAERDAAPAPSPLVPGWHPSFPGPAPWEEPGDFTAAELLAPTESVELVPYEDRPRTPEELVLEVPVEVAEREVFAGSVLVAPNEDFEAFRGLGRRIVSEAQADAEG